MDLSDVVPSYLKIRMQFDIMWNVTFSWKDIGEKTYIFKKEDYCHLMTFLNRINSIGIYYSGTQISTRVKILCKMAFSQGRWNLSTLEKLQNENKIHIA